MEAIQIEPMRCWVVALLKRTGKGTVNVRYLVDQTFETRDAAEVFLNDTLEKLSLMGESFVRSDFQLHFVKLSRQVEVITDPEEIRQNVEVSRSFKDNQLKLMRNIGLNRGMEKLASRFLSNGYKLFDSSHLEFVPYEVNIPSDALILYRGDLPSGQYQMVAYRPGYHTFAHIKNFNFPDSSEVAEQPL